MLYSFQPQQLCTQIKIMRALEDDTDYKLKTLREADLNLVSGGAVLLPWTKFSKQDKTWAEFTS
jgi:hypothetical protein